MQAYPGTVWGRQPALANAPRPRYAYGMNTLLLTLLCAANVAGQLDVDAAHVDHGDVRTGPPLVQRFKLTNPTNATITIVEVDAGCGCLKPTISAKLLKPGSTATLTITVNTLTQPAGPNRWPIRISYAIGESVPQMLEVSVRAKLIEDVTVTPPSLAISTTAEATQTVSVTDRDAKPLTITSVTVTNPHITATIDAERSLTVKALSTLPIGTHNETLRITTNNPRCPELYVAVQVVKHKKQAIRAYPSGLVLTLPTASQLVQLRRTDGKLIAIDSAVSSSSDIAVSASEGTGLVATLRVRLNAKNAGQTSVNIKFKDGSTITIPVSWR